MATGAAVQLVTSVIVARRLGPAGKGLVSMLTYLVALGVPVAALGTGEAAITLVRRHGTSLERACRASLGLLAVAAPIGVLAVAASAAGIEGLHPGDLNLVLALGATAITLPLATTFRLLSHLLDSQQRVPFTSAIQALVIVVTAVATFLAVDLLSWSVFGAMAAVATGWAAGCTILLVALARGGVSLKPRFDREYLHRALRLGIPVGLSTLVVVASTRLDLLLVGSLAGRAAAGQYSVSTSIGSLVTYAPSALAIAAYPRLASLPDDATVELTGRLFRVGVLAALGTALALVALVPPAVTFVFGKAFDGAVVPALVLVGDGVVWAAQWVLCRAAAARGETRLLLWSFLSDLAVMLVLDLALIPTYGATGAAIASTAGSLAGLSIALGFVRRGGPSAIPLRSLVPRMRDLRELRAVAAMLATAKPAD